MPHRCHDERALVTGASRGIGRAIAQRLAAEGARVAVVGRSTSRAGERTLEGSVEETAEVITQAGGFAIPMVADIGSPAARARLAADAPEMLGGPVTVLVNCAAGDRHFDLRFDTTPESAFNATMNVNVWAAWHLAALLVPGMREAGRGWILNVSSRQAAPRPGPPFPTHQHGGACLYGASKAMLDRVTSGAAMDLYQDNIAVNSLAPEAAVLTEHAALVATIDDDHIEPVETFVTAALALLTAQPRSRTGRVAYSLSLIKELGEPVHTIDAKSLLPGWQPRDIDDRRLFAGYLRG